MPTANEPKASYYLKIFGNEIRYGDLLDLDLSSLKEKFNYLDWLIELAKERNFDVHKNIVLLDSTINIPTVAGLPLRLRVDGTAAVNLQMKGKMDMLQLMANRPSVDIVGYVMPRSVTAPQSVSTDVAIKGV